MTPAQRAQRAILERHQRRQERKLLVFPIQGATEFEMTVWRRICADFINGHRDDYPPTLEALRNDPH